jgi:glycosyltransferase involved in cell wall biosynthesis
LRVPARSFPTPGTAAATRLAVIGRLNPNKGQDLAIAAVDALRARGRDGSLEIAGTVFPGYEEVERGLRASAAGLGDRVRFSGFCDDVWDLLARTDIVLAPSRTDSLPLVVIEAMLAGRAIVAADVGGMSELLRDGETGRLVPVEDAGALVGAVERLLNFPGEAAGLGARAREDAMARFGIERFAGEIVAVAEAVLASHLRRRSPA